VCSPLSDSNRGIIIILLSFNESVTYNLDLLFGSVDHLYGNDSDRRFSSWTGDQKIVPGRSKYEVFWYEGHMNKATQIRVKYPLLAILRVRNELAILGVPNYRFLKNFKISVPGK